MAFVFAAVLPLNAGPLALDVTKKKTGNAVTQKESGMASPAGMRTHELCGWGWNPSPKLLLSNKSGCLLCRFNNVGFALGGYYCFQCTVL